MIADVGNVAVNMYVSPHNRLLVDYFVFQTLEGNKKEKFS